MTSKRRDAASRKSSKLPSLGLTFARRERGQGYQISETASGSADQAPRAALCFFCDGALSFHAARGTHVANIYKSFCYRRAFLCFHRPIAAGTPHDRRFIYTILHGRAP